MLLYLTLNDLDGQFKVTYFKRSISGKGAQLGLLLLLNTNKKSHVRSPTSLLYLTLSDLERPENQHVHLSD